MSRWMAQDQSERVEHKAMSYERMKKREAELKAEVARMLAAAEGRTPKRTRLRQGQARDEMPDWVGDKQKRLAKIQRAMARWRRTPGWQWRKSVASSRKGTAAPSRRPQEAGQTGGAAIGPT